MKIEVVRGKYHVSKVSSIPAHWDTDFLMSVTVAEEEISVVSEEHFLQENSISEEKDFRILKVVGPLDFSLIGMIAEIATVLAGGGISIFTLSTFNTDYILIKEYHLEQALQLLMKNNHEIIR